MKNRTDEIWTALGDFINERSVADVLLTIARFEENAGTLVPDMRRALLECDEKARRLRRDGEKGETAFIALSFLDTSVMTGAFDLRVDFYDASFLCDIAEACAYFPYAYLRPIYGESVAALCGEAAKSVVRFMDYERDAIARKYKNEVLYKLVMSVCSLCLLHPDMTGLWPELTLADDCLFTFGRLLNDHQLYLRVPKPSGVIRQ
jgi:hypothetical protein